VQEPEVPRLPNIFLKLAMLLSFCIGKKNEIFSSNLIHIILTSFIAVIQIVLDFY
jgi:hypothetical protein